MNPISNRAHFRNILFCCEGDLAFCIYYFSQVSTWQSATVGAQDVKTGSSLPVCEFRRRRRTQSVIILVKPAVPLAKHNFWLREPIVIVISACGRILTMPDLIAYLPLKWLRAPWERVDCSWHYLKNDSFIRAGTGGTDLQLSGSSVADCLRLT